MIFIKNKITLGLSILVFCINMVLLPLNVINGPLWLVLLNITLMGTYIFNFLFAIEQDKIQFNMLVYAEADRLLKKKEKRRKYR